MKSEGGRFRHDDDPFSDLPAEEIRSSGLATARPAREHDTASPMVVLHVSRHAAAPPIRFEARTACRKLISSPMFSIVTMPTTRPESTTGREVHWQP